MYECVALDTMSFSANNGTSFVNYTLNEIEALANRTCGPGDLSLKL